MSRAERSDARQNRERIIDAARVLFLEHGTAVEMRQLAERAGVGIGTVYRNFPAKSDLVSAVAADILNETSAALDDVLALDDPVEVVARYVEVLAETFARTAPLAMDLMAAPAFETIRSQVLSWFAEPRLQRAIERGIQRGVFRPDLDPEAARLFVAGAADPLLILAVGPGPLPHRFRRSLVDLVLRALLAPGAGLPPGPAAKGT